MIMTNQTSACIALSNSIVTQSYVDQETEFIILLILCWH